MSEANPERGEHQLMLAGMSYRLRPSFEAAVAIEAKTERTLLELVSHANRGALTLKQIGIVAAEYIRAGADDELTRRVSADRIGELAYREGLGAVMPVLTLVLLDAVTGGIDPSGEAPAPAA